MLTQHNRKTCRLSPDYTFAIRELGVWSGDETMVVCAGSLTITFDLTSGQRSYSNLEKFHEVFWGTKLQGKG